MKKLLFFSAIIMAMFFTASCVKEACCTQKQVNTSTNQEPDMYQKTIKRGAYFTDGYLYDCIVNGIAEVRDRNGNHPQEMPVYDELILQRADPNQGGWNFALCGPARVGGGADVKVWVYKHNGLLVPGRDPEIVESSWVMDEFYGESLRKWNPKDTSIFGGKLPIWARGDKSLFRSALTGQNCKIMLSPELAVLVQKDSLRMKFDFVSSTKDELSQKTTRFYSNDKDLRPISIFEEESKK